MEKKIMKLNAVSTSIGVALTAACATTAMGQQITGTPGAANATTTVDGRYLPNPPAPFGGEIGLSAPLRSKLTISGL